MSQPSVPHGANLSVFCLLEKCVSGELYVCNVGVVLYRAGITIVSVCSAGWSTVGRMGPKTISNSYRQFHVCTSAIDEYKSRVSCLLTGGFCLHVCIFPVFAVIFSIVFVDVGRTVGRDRFSDMLGRLVERMQSYRDVVLETVVLVSRPLETGRNFEVLFLVLALVVLVVVLDCVKSASAFEK